MLIFQALRCLSLKLSFKGKRYTARSLSPRYNSGCRPYPRHGDIWVLLAGDWICLEGNREGLGAVGPSCASFHPSALPGKLWHGRGGSRSRVWCNPRFIQPQVKVLPWPQESEGLFIKESLHLPPEGVENASQPLI